MVGSRRKEAGEGLGVMELGSEEKRRSEDERKQKAGLVVESFVASFEAKEV